MNSRIQGKVTYVMKRLVSLMVFGIVSLILIAAGCRAPAAVSPTAKPQMPLLDREIPAAVETASFAMG